MMTAAPKTHATTTMKAWTYDRYGEVDRLTRRDVPVPEPGGGQILVRVAAASLNAKDWRLWTANPGIVRLIFGLRRPRRPRGLGTDAAGVVVAVGPGVDGFRVGDEVIAEVEAGALAEYVIVEADHAAPKPATLTFEEAAAVPLAGLTALEAVRDVGAVGPGDRVLVNGAAGGVGTFAVQLAKALGASHVTGVCSTRNLEQTLHAGADRAIDYAGEDFTRLGERFDVLIDAAGGHSLRAVRRVLKPRARVAIVGGGGGTWLGPLGQTLRWTVLNLFVGQRIGGVTTKVTRAKLEALTGLIDGGEVRPMVEIVYSFDEVPDAMRYVVTGHARAKVVVAVRPQ